MVVVVEDFAVGCKDKLLKNSFANGKISFGDLIHLESISNLDNFPKLCLFVKKLKITSNSFLLLSSNKGKHI